MTAEDKLQELAVAWFDSKYPELKLNLYHCPNGGSRNAIEGAKFKRMGVRAGVADLILNIPRHGYGSLCLEAKVRKGDIYRIGNKNIMVKKNGIQSPAQHEWELAAMSAGNKYVLFWNVNDFIREIEAYLK